MELNEMLSNFDYSYPRVHELYKKGILSAEDVNELWDIRFKVMTLAFETILNTSSEEHFMQEVREWFLKHTPYGGERLFFFTYGTSGGWIQIYSKNDRVILVRRDVSEGLNLPLMNYSVLTHYSVNLDTMYDFDELGRYFLECALNGFFEPIDFALEFAFNNKRVYKEKTMLLMLKKHFLEGEDIAKLEKDFFTRQNYRERVKNCIEQLTQKRVVNAGDMWFVLPWYRGNGIIFWEKEKDEVLVSLAPREACGRLMNSGKYKQLKQVTRPMTVGEFTTNLSELAKAAFKLLESRLEILDITLRTVVLLYEL